MGGHCCLFFAAFTILVACSIAEKAHKHDLVKRQLPQRSSPQRAFPLSRSRQFPAPDELVEEIVSDEEPVYDDPAPAESPLPRFRGRQLPPVEDTPEDYPYTEAPQTTIPPPTSRTPNRISAFNRNANRPRFGSNSQSAPATAAVVPTLTTVSTTRSRSRFTSAPAERIDVVADILNRTPPPRSPQRSTLAPRATSANPVPAEQPAIEENTGPAARRIGTGRTRNRSRVRARSSTTTTTTTTTTTPPPPAEDDYYYYYEDEEAQPIATTTTTTTTTARPPSLPRRASLGRRPSNARLSTTARPVKFDLDSQFQAPPDDEPVPLASSSTKRFTTSTTEPPGPGGIPAHLKGMYKPRADNRFIDYYRDPNRPRELKGFDLTDYPFYIRVPEDIDFNCDDMKDGYYASIPHNCQLFHYCFAGARYDFLCANYTLYDQTTFTCRFANNVDCESSAKYYYRNDDLWKETTTIPPVEQKKKKVTSKDEDYEEYDEDEEYYDDEEDEERRRPAKRRRNRRRKNRRKASES